MNTTPQQTSDLESLRKAVQEFRPNPHRVPFNGLKPVHEAIAALRQKNASYAAIADLLQQHGVKTSRARVAEYGRIVLEGGKSRKRRKRANIAPAVSTPATPQIAPGVAAIPAPTSPAPTAAPGITPPPPIGDSSCRSRGPRIANLRMLKPEASKQGDASLPSEQSPKP
jgi:hypothetical protein